MGASTKIYVFACLAALAVISCGNQVVPYRWNKSSTSPAKYLVGVDQQISYSENNSAYLKSISNEITKDDSVKLYQNVLADSYKGKVIRFSARMKTSNIVGQSGLYMQSMTQHINTIIDYADTMDTPLSGTKDWSLRTIIINISETGDVLQFGAYLNGRGEVWVDSVSIEVIGPSTKSTAAQQKLTT